MYVSVLDRTLVEAAYQTPGAGLRDLRLDSIELVADRECRVPMLAADQLSTISIADSTGARTYRAHLYQLVLKVCAIGLYWDSLPDGADRLDWIIRLLHAAEIIGAPVVRISVFAGQMIRAPGSVLSAVMEVIQQAIVATPRSPVALALQTCGPLARDVSSLASILRDCAVERLGLALDPGSLYRSGHPLPDLYGLIRELAPAVRHVHCENVRFPSEFEPQLPESEQVSDHIACRLDEGDLDYARIASILGNMGYSGALVVVQEAETERRPPERQHALRSDIAYLKDILGGG